MKIDSRLYFWRTWSAAEAYTCSISLLNLVFRILPCFITRRRHSTSRSSAREGHAGDTTSPSREETQDEKSAGEEARKTEQLPARKGRPHRAKVWRGPLGHPLSTFLRRLPDFFSRFPQTLCRRQAPGWRAGTKKNNAGRNVWRH